MKRFLLFAASLFLFCALPACALFADKTDDRTLDELARYMILKTGATPCCDMEPGPVHAAGGFSITLDGRQVAFYKYDLKKKKMAEKLKWIREHGFVRIYGKKFTAAINGSFIMIDYDTNRKKELLLETFRKF